MGLSLLALGATPAAAQDRGKVGITMGFPASIGVLWRASDKVAIRPELALSGNSSESTSSSFESEANGWTIATGASILFYLNTYDNLRTYFTPRFTYSRLSTTSELDGPFTDPTTKTTGNSVGATGSFGAEYSLGNKFAVFGEAGFGFSRASTTSSSTTAAKVTGNSWGTRAGVGVIFFP
jgi:hypothetical protein